MNILYINHYAGSPRHGMSFRSFYLAREWVRAGHGVTMVAASWSHLRRVQPEVDGDHAIETIDGVRYVWLKTPPYQGNGGGRIRNMVAFLARLGRLRRVLPGERYDAVITSSTYPFDAVPAARLARAWGAAYVHEVHDLWPLSPIELGGYSRIHPFIVATQAAEDFAYRRADAVVSLLPAAEPYMRSRGLAPGKFRFVPNGIDMDEWKDVKPLPSGLPERLDGFARGRFLVGYAGGHGLSNALDYLIEAARLAPGMAFALVGQGPEKDRLVAAAEGLDNVLFLDPVPKECVPALLSRMDALYLGWTPSPLYRFGISPNKLFDYMMAGKPIVHAVEAANDPCAEAGAGISIPPGDARAIVDALNALREAPSGERARMGALGRDYAMRNHDYAVLAREFLDAIQGALKAARV